MPYRNVYEEQISRHGKHGAQEPEKDPKKIEEIYRDQLPTDEEFKHRQQKLKREQRRLEKAKHTNRGIKGSIIDN